MSKPSLGKFEGGSAAIIDVEHLLETRMLVQANSGGGKSWAIRRLLEQTAGRVQQLVIDPEGEFSTLREKFDFVIAAPHDGDALAHPRTAKLLAHRLLETGVSAILDIYDLKAHERQAFVRTFLDAIVNAPKALWRPALIVLDEAHVYAPEHGKAESTGAVIDLATRGRKRGFALIAATQRLAKLHKDCAAELLNKLIGRTGLDVDVKRAADEIGMGAREAMETLRPLAPGHFFAFGPALSATVREIEIGDIQTSHPKIGDRTLRAPPKPTAAIRAVLPKLADLPKEAEQEARSIADLQKEVSTLRRELTQKAKKAPPAAAATDVANAGELRAAKTTIKRLAAAIEALMKFVVEINVVGFENTAGVDPGALQKAIDSAVAQALKLVDQKLDQRAKTLQGLQREGGRLIANVKKILADQDLTVKVDVKHNEPFTVKTMAPPPAQRRSAPARVDHPITEGVTAPQQKLLDKLAWLEAYGLYPAPKETLAAVAGVSPTSGGYFNNLGALRNKLGLIEYPTPGEVEFTEAGRAAANPSDDERPVHEHWLEVVTPPQRKILEALIERHPDPIAKDDLAGAINVSATSGGYFNNLGRLRTLGAIDYPQKSQVALTRHVMPEAR